MLLAEFKTLELHKVQAEHHPSSGIRTSDWYGVGGGEAGWAVSDWSDPNIVYAGEYGGIITRYDHRTRQARHIGINPDMPIGHEPKDMRFRFQWTAPIPCLTT